MKEVKITFTETQRKAVGAMLERYQPLWERAHDTYDKTHDALVDFLIRKEAEAKAWSSEIDEYIKINKKVHDYRRSLASHGVELDDEGMLSFSDDSSPLKLLIGAKVSQNIGERSDVSRLFEDARVKLMTAETTEEAEKILMPILKFEVNAQ